MHAIPDRDGKSITLIDSFPRIIRREGKPQKSSAESPAI